MNSILANPDLISLAIKLIVGGGILGVITYVATRLIKYGKDQAEQERLQDQLNDIKVAEESKQKVNNEIINHKPGAGIAALHELRKEADK